MDSEALLLSRSLNVPGVFARSDVGRMPEMGQVMRGAIGISNAPASPDFFPGPLARSDGIHGNLSSIHFDYS